MKSRKLLDLEDKIGEAQSVGRPMIIRVTGNEIGIDYIGTIGKGDGLLKNDRDKAEYIFLYKIEKNAPEEANSFSASNIERTSYVYFWEGAKAVQYYKTRNKGRKS